MATEMEGMKITISADASQAIRTIQDFQNKFRSMANTVNSMTINASVSMTDFNNSIGDIGNVTNIAQMQNLQKSMKGINVIQSKNTQGMKNNLDASKALIDKSEKEQKEKGKLGKILKIIEKHWTAIGVAAIAALVGIIKGSSLAGMWMSELSGIFQYFADSALTPLSPLFEGILSLLWSLADAFATLDPEIQAIVGAFGLVLVVGGALATFVGWITGTTGFAVITTVITALAAALGLPVYATAILVAAVVAGIALLIVHWNDITAFIAKAWDYAITKITTAWEGVKTYLLGAWDSIKNSVSNAWDYVKNTITGAVQSAYDTIVKIVNKIKNAITSVPGVQTAINIATNAYKSASSYMGYAQGTSSVLADGLYKLHSGEKVIPKGENSTENNQSSVVFNNTFTINNPVMKSDTDIRQLAAQLDRYWQSDMNRRGITF